MSQFNIYSMLEEYTAAANRPSLPTIHSMGSLPALLRSYGKILGWNFRFAPFDKNLIPADLTAALGDNLFDNYNSNNNPKYRTDSPETAEKSAHSPLIDIHVNPKQSNFSIYDSDITELNCQKKESELFSKFMPGTSKPEYIPVEIKTGDGRVSVVGKVEYSPQDSVWSNLHLLARQAASAIADIVGELLSTRYQLWRRESELATKSTVPINEMGDREIAFLLQNILRGGAEGLNCQASAMYLLDDQTSELKMRSCWGLPAERLQDSARPLGNAMADLEAMIGHAVVMEDAAACARWHAPEDFSAALCVPVLAESSILGTVWFYCTKSRKFTDSQSQLAEIIAGRLATELEREVLLENYAHTRDWKQEIKAAADLQKNQLPISAPWIETWDLAGKLNQKDDFGGNFYDWFSLPNGKQVCALGDCQNQGLTAALVAGSVKTAFRCHAQHQTNMDSLIEQIDRTIWSASAADQYANLFCAILSPEDDKIYFSNAGNQKIYLIGENGVRDYSQKAPLLGSAVQSEYHANCVRIQKNEALVILSNRVENRTTADNRPFEYDRILENVRENLNRNAKFVIREMYGMIEYQYPQSKNADYSLMVIKRKSSNRR